jgi:hypothetical protein
VWSTCSPCGRHLNCTTGWFASWRRLRIGCHLWHPTQRSVRRSKHSAQVPRNRCRRFTFEIVHEWWGSRF